jgi:3',5'-cyclic AMP phosphodiesterase CpdA
MSNFDYTRRDFLRTSTMAAGGCAAGIHGVQAQQADADIPDADELILKIGGVDKEFSFIHWTDAHLSECDQRDEKLVKTLAKRAKVFGGNPTGVARGMVRQFNALKPDLVAMTGDLLDVPTKKNIEIGAEILKSIDSPSFFTMGNHEWCPPAVPPDRDYWRPRLRPMTEQSLDWHVQQFHGVNLLFVDDSDYQITEEQLRKTQKLLEDGRSCILFLHIPVATESLVPSTVKRWGTPILLGAEGISANKRKHWGIGEGNEPSTAAFCKLVKTHPQVSAIFAGHIHIDHEGEYRQGCHQYVTGGGFEKRYRKVRVVS